VAHRPEWLGEKGFCWVGKDSNCHSCLEKKMGLGAGVSPQSSEKKKKSGRLGEDDVWLGAMKKELLRKKRTGPGKIQDGFESGVNRAYQQKGCAAGNL